ncbi:hypothetical protein MMC06_004979 [Schaereria dolodes]|nr:hypothetical protein [Schaereria dolodes]
MASFTADSIPDLRGKIIFVTGGNTGLGKNSILLFAKHNPDHIYLSGRDPKKGAAAVNDIKAAIPHVAITFVECDLASLSSVANAAKQFTTSSQRLDVLVCNAGLYAQPPGLTQDGYELMFGVNHLGHALLIKLLLPTLLETAAQPGGDARIISLTSQGFAFHPRAGIIFKELRTTQNYFGGEALRYGQSKLANILYAAELARRYPSITTVSIHPGVVSTDLVEKLSFWRKALVYVSQAGHLLMPEEGALNQVWASTAPKEQIVNGEYYEPVGKAGVHRRMSINKVLARELWEWTQKELEGYTA